MKLPTPTQRPQGNFKWIVDPASSHTDPNTATWFCDGSLINGGQVDFRATGIGIAVVSDDGELIGYGYGSPPSWVATAAAAELWATETVLSNTPFPPKIKTDCLSILTAAHGGSQTAERHDRSLARLWRSIRGIIGQDARSLIDNGNLCWIPAHLTLSAVGERRLRDGSKFSIVDWS